MARKTFMAQRGFVHQDITVRVSFVSEGDSTPEMQGLAK